jgi:disulfide bond formation protein DsbB
VTQLGRAHALALLIPAALLAGAWYSQLVWNLYPCAMCHWQRWPHYAAVAIAVMAHGVKPMRGVLVGLAAFAILTSGAIGVYHAGVEYHWWLGPPCASTAAGSSLKDILAAPLISCDQPQWTFQGVSLAGFNAIISIASGLAVLVMLRRVR